MKGQRMYRAQAVTEDEVREVVRVGAPVGVTMFPQWVHPFFMLCGIPAELDAVKNDRWTVVHGGVNGQLGPLEQLAWEVSKGLESRPMAALALVCVNGVLRHPDGVVYVQGCVIDVSATSMYPHAGPRMAAVPGGRQLREAVEGWLGANLDTRPPLYAEAVAELFNIDPEGAVVIEFDPDSRRVIEPAEFKPEYGA